MTWPTDPDKARWALAAAVYDLVVNCAETVDADLMHRRQTWDELPADVQAYAAEAVWSGLVLYIAPEIPTVPRVQEPPC